jgi:hypothetical protein
VRPCVADSFGEFVLPTDQSLFCKRCYGGTFLMMS